LNDNVLGETPIDPPQQFEAGDSATVWLPGGTPRHHKQDEQGYPVPVYDIRYDSDMHVQLVAVNASDDMVVAAARVSTLGADTGTYVEDQPSELLIKYLMRNRHGSPFEHNQFTFLITAPVFVMREFHRHRVGWSYNEESARYRELQPHFWVPEVGRKLVQIGKSGHYELTHGTPETELAVTEATHVAYEVAWRAYRKMLNAGVAREVARTVLPVGIYSSMYATCNARSLMHFLSLRTSAPSAAYPSKPQAEIEQVARAMEQFLGQHMQFTWRAFQQYGRVAP